MMEITAVFSRGTIHYREATYYITQNRSFSL
jgi:hypothetical protein